MHSTPKCSCGTWLLRLRNRVQLTTDGHRAYLLAVESAFDADIDYALLTSSTRAPEPEAMNGATAPPSAPASMSARHGRPRPGEISTSYVERQNLTMRMGMRRFTRLTNGFSKKVENLAHAVALHYMHYNFTR